MKHLFGRRGAKTEDQAASDRLDTWKEIATYLRRDVRTVHRWEKEEGLPVRRHHHNRLSTVFAYRSEIDEWWRKREGTGTSRTAKSAPLKRTFFITTAMLMLASASFWFYWNWGFLEDQISPGQVEQLWTLITDFENRSGDPQLDGVLEYALRLELSKSDRMRLVSRPQVEDILKLMREPANSRVNVPLGRQVCIRDGRIPVMIGGLIEKLDSQYRLSVHIIDPYAISPERIHSLTAESESEILSITNELAIWVRGRLGEVLPKAEGNDQLMRRVTTPSLKALKLFIQQDRLLREQRSEAAVGMLQAALAEDPDFAVGYAWLAYALWNSGHPFSEVLDCIQLAVNSSSGVSEWERYHIFGSYHELNGDWEKALPYWEALCEQYPDDYWGFNHLYITYRMLGEEEQFLRQVVSWAEQRPHDFRSNWEAALALSRKAPYEPNPYWVRAEKLCDDSVSSDYPHHWAAVKLHDATQYWVDQKPDLVLQEVERAASELNDFEGRLRSALTLEIAHQYIQIGRIGTAESLAESLSGFSRTSILTQISLAGGQPLQPEQAMPLGTVVIALARSGHLEAARDVLADLKNQVAPFLLVQPRFGICAAEIALADNNTDEAIRLLNHNLQMLRGRAISASPRILFLGTEALAIAFCRQGNLDLARETLSGLVDPDLTAAYPEAGWISLRLRWHLAQIEYDAGRHRSYEGHVSKLKHLLKFADRDHPILTAIRSIDSIASPQGGHVCL